jgi:hypothetical protein
MPAAEQCLNRWPEVTFHWVNLWQPWRSSCDAIRRQCFSDCDKRLAISASQG